MLSSRSLVIIASVAALGCGSGDGARGADSTTYPYCHTDGGDGGTGPDSGTVSSADSGAATPAAHPHLPNCGMQRSTGALAFCESFDAPAGIGNRSGDLDGTLWGASRTTGDINPGQGRPYGWADAQLDLCGSQVSTHSEGSDIRICNGQLREATNDNISGGFEAGTVTALTMYVKQPFDFAGRTGTVAFDVSNDTAGTHSAWPEFWMSDKPVPGPFSHFTSWIAYPQNGFGIRFGAGVGPGQYGSCPTADNTYRWTVDSAVVSRDYAFEDTTGSAVTTGMKLQILDCVTEPSGPNAGLNHIEVQVSQSQIDVYASDAGTTAPLKHIAVILDANLTFSRGLVWFDDVHYNADKGDPNRPTQHNHTFAWDNVGFDGPALPRDLSFDVLDSLGPVTGGAFLGWAATSDSPASLQTLPMTTANIQAASGAFLLFDMWSMAAPLTFTYSINGHTHTAPWPYTDVTASQSFTIRTLALPVPLSDLINGANGISLFASDLIEVANVNIVLVAAGGIVLP